MTTRHHRALLAAVLRWALIPIALLAVRALAQSWRFPQIVPAMTDAWASWPAAASGRLVSALAVSITLAITAGIIGTVLGFAIARSVAYSSATCRRLTLAAAFFTVIAPPLALGVGLQVAMLGAGLGGTFGGVLLAHLVPVTGYLTLFALGVFSSMNRSLEGEARTLGASRWQVLSRVLVPLLRRRLGEALILGGLVSWGQVAITLLVGGGLVRTLPMELMSIVQSGDDRIAASAALMLSLPPMLAIGVLTIGARRTGASV